MTSKYNKKIAELEAVIDKQKKELLKLSGLEKLLEKAKETAEVGSETKAESIANLSHELRTLISDMIEMAKVLEIEGGTKKDRGYRRTMQTSSKRLLLLLNDILDVISVKYHWNDRKLGVQEQSLDAAIQPDKQQI